MDAQQAQGGAAADPAAPCNRDVHERLIAMEAADRARQEMMPGLLEVIRQQGQRQDDRPVHHKPVKTPNYDGKSDVRQFLNLFNQVAEVNRWEEAETCLQLRLALNGTARQCLQGDTYEELTQSLLNRYEMSEDEALRELRSLKWRSGEDLHQFADYAKRLVERANPRLAEDQLQAMAIREIVEATGDRHLRREFRLHPLEDYSEALAWIHDYLNDMGKDRRPHIRRVCATDEKADDDDPEVTKIKVNITDLQTKMSKLESQLTNELQGVKTDMRSGQAELKAMLSVLMSGSSNNHSQGSWNDNSRAQQPENWRSQKPTNFQPNSYCQHCRRPGHVIEECRTLQYKQRQQAAAPTTPAIPSGNTQGSSTPARV